MSILLIFIVFDLFRLLPCRVLPGPCKDAVYIVSGATNLGEAVGGMVLRIPNVIFVSEDIAGDPPIDYRAVLMHEEHHIRWSLIRTMVITMTAAVLVMPFDYLIALLTLYHHINVIESYSLTFLLYGSFIMFFSITILVYPMLDEALADLTAYYSVGRAPPSVLLRRKSVMNVSEFTKRFREFMWRVRARYGKLAMVPLILIYPFTYLDLSLISFVHPDFRRFIISRNPFSLLPPWALALPASAISSAVSLSLAVQVLGPKFISLLPPYSSNPPYSATVVYFLTFVASFGTLMLFAVIGKPIVKALTKPINDYGVYSMTAWSIAFYVMTYSIALGLLRLFLDNHYPLLTLAAPTPIAFATLTLFLTLFLRSVRQSLLVSVATYITLVIVSLVVLGMFLVFYHV
ncbi:hypothetical protein [Vulcanisaeta distributa]|uniref:hypothetical protein n=1 Tax=Vulcanisaeta distributa TaxID=164451 RepID=UPI001FB545EB|nr:hypothetical protein [Vulcanisaeta distributa]